MSMVIPYVPGLAMGGIVDPSLLKSLVAVSEAQSIVNAAQDKLNSYISMKKSLDMTIQEMIDMNLDTGDLTEKLKTVAQQVTKAAEDYVQLRLDQELKIQSIKNDMPHVTSQYMSPVDFNSTIFKKDLPLSSDSLKLDSQYFFFESNDTKDPTIGKIKKYIASQTGALGADNGEKVSSAVADQIDRQRDNHDIEGTLIITATCTHKNAIILTPLVLDTDRAIGAWNNTYTDDQIKEDDLSPVTEVKNSDNKSIDILSGATFGSCFVGMVHVLKSESSTSSDRSMKSIAEALQEKAKLGQWLEDKKGGVGIDPIVESDMRSLLSKADIKSHITIITMGVIPSIVSNQVQHSVKEFAKFNPEDVMGQLAIMDSETTTKTESVDSVAQDSRRGQRIITLTNSKIDTLVSSVSKDDKDANKILDVTSLMKAFEDYIKKASEGSAGVPINYYLTKFTKSEIARMRDAKYYSKKYLSMTKIDDGQKTITADDKNN